MIGKMFMSTGAVILAFALEAGSSSDPTKIIFDTDMYTDFDDVGALACLHALADEGKCEILATVSSTRGTPSVGVCQAINAWYGRGDIPVGAPREIGITVPETPRYAYPIYQRLVGERPECFQSSDDAPDANAVYRRVLAGQPDGSVTVCSVGFMTNLRRLLETRGDEFSPLSGKELVARKVRAWYAMACRYPDGKEYNSSRDAESSRIVLRDWPTPVYFVDWWLGGAVRCGVPVSKVSCERSPVARVFREALKDFGETEKGHPAWDQVTVLAAVGGMGEDFGAERGRFRITGADGRNDWTADRDGLHRRLYALTPVRELAHRIDELMARTPRAVSKENKERK